MCFLVSEMDGLQSLSLHTMAFCSWWRLKKKEVTQHWHAECYVHPGSSWALVVRLQSIAL